MKNYLILTILLLFVNLSDAQSAAISTTSSSTIEGLQMYPNPVKSDKIYITTKHNLTKTVEVYNVLGKRVISTSLQTKALDISRLTPGIYIIKITENRFSATRKLVVR